LGGCLFVFSAIFLSFGLAGLLFLQLILQWTQGKNIIFKHCVLVLRLFSAGCRQEILPFVAPCLLTE
jgi:hypothetical protein